MDWTELLDQIAQVQITIMTFITPHLVSSPDRRRRLWGFCLGMTTMPAWFFTAMVPTLKWGLVICNISYVIAYLRGIWTHRR